jgi:transcription elongation GreA/GreB family factor
MRPWASLRRVAEQSKAEEETMVLHGEPANRRPTHMLSKNRLAAALASAGIAMAMLPATAGAATALEPSSPTAGQVTMTGATVEVARKAGGEPQEYVQVDQPPTIDPTGGLVTIVSAIANAIVSLVP